LHQALTLRFFLQLWPPIAEVSLAVLVALVQVIAYFVS